MTFRDYQILTDENIHPDVVAYLRANGVNVTTAVEAALRAAPDSELLRFAFETNRIVLTHDRDFGYLAIAGGSPVIGIVYLRPGQIQTAPTIDSLRRLLAGNLELKSPFLLVAARRADRLRIRIRKLGTGN